MQRQEKVLDLSEEIWINIFLFLDAKTLCLLCLVSKDVRRLAEDNHLWHQKIRHDKGLSQLSFLNETNYKNLYFSKIKKISAYQIEYNHNHGGYPVGECRGICYCFNHNDERATLRFIKDEQKNFHLLIKYLEGKEAVSKDVYILDIYFISTSNKNYIVKGKYLTEDEDEAYDRLDDKHYATLGNKHTKCIVPRPINKNLLDDLSFNVITEKEPPVWIKEFILKIMKETEYFKRQNTKAELDCLFDEFEKFDKENKRRCLVS